MTGPSVTQDGSELVVARPSVLAMPRRRGSFIGILLILLGLWGGLAPLIGPWFGYHVDDAQAWVLTWDRLWLTTVPAAAAVIGGLLLYLSRDRLTASIGAWLALAGGAWFVVGPSVSALWSSEISATGIGRGGTAERVLVQLLSFYGLGTAITALASFALARVLIRSERDALRLRDEAAAATEAARLREERDRAQAQADQAALARAATEREHQQAQQEREQLRPAGSPGGMSTYQPGTAPAYQPGTEPAHRPSAAPAYQSSAAPAYQPAVNPPAGPTALPGQRPAPAVSGEYPTAGDAAGGSVGSPGSGSSDYYRSSPTEPGDPERR